MDLSDLHPLLGLRGDDTSEAASVLMSNEPLVVHLTSAEEPHTIRAAAAQLHQMPTVTVLVADPATAPRELVDAVDVALSTTPSPPRPWVHARVEPIRAAVGDHPHAALALAVLLRTAGSRPVWDMVASEAATYAMLLDGQDHAAWLAARPAVGGHRTASFGGTALLVHRDGPRLTVGLHRPEVHNAIDTAVRDQLVQALALPRADPTITRVDLVGHGPSFSSGGDLTEFGSVSDGPTSFAVRLTRHPGLAVHSIADRVSAHLHGSCVGAGIEITAFADRVFAAPDTLIQLPELAMGLVPGAGGTVSLPRRIGRHRTAWLALTCERIGAAQAREWGLVDELVPASTVA